MRTLTRRRVLGLGLGAVAAGMVGGCSTPGTISVNSQSYMSAAAIVSQSDHLLVLPSMVAELLSHHWPLKSLPLPEDFDS